MPLSGEAVPEQTGTMRAGWGRGWKAGGSGSQHPTPQPPQPCCTPWPGLLCTQGCLAGLRELALPTQQLGLFLFLWRRRAVASRRGSGAPPQRHSCPPLQPAHQPAGYTAFTYAAASGQGLGQEPLESHWGGGFSLWGGGLLRGVASVMRTSSSHAQRGPSQLPHAQTGALGGSRKRAPPG